MVCRKEGGKSLGRKIRGWVSTYAPFTSLIWISPHSDLCYLWKPTRRSCQMQNPSANFSLIFKVSSDSAFNAKLSNGRLFLVLSLMHLLTERQFYLFARSHCPGTIPWVPHRGYPKPVTQVLDRNERAIFWNHRVSGVPTNLLKPLEQIFGCRWFIKASGISGRIMALPRRVEFYRYRRYISFSMLPSYWLVVHLFINVVLPSFLTAERERSCVADFSFCLLELCAMVLSW